jgi:hypothetical protein
LPGLFVFGYSAGTFSGGNVLAEQNDKAHAELLVLYKNATEDLERTKQRQWREFYGVLVSQGALVGLLKAQADRPLGFWDVHWAFFVALLLLLLLGLLLLGIAQHRLCTLQGLIELYEDKLHPDTQQLLESDEAMAQYREFYPLVQTLVLLAAWWFFSRIVLQK